jgi:predicted secreted hydrolase
MEKFRFIISIIVGSFIFLFLGIFVSASDSWFYVTGPCHLKFPEDHGPHPGFRTEWWYYTGNVSDNNGVEFGFQLTFFRRQIGNGSIDISQRSGEVSPWRTQQLILAHAALTEISEKKHYQAELMARQALDIAGAFQKG